MVTAVAVSQHCLSQGFVNLAFEDATIILAGSQNTIEASSALPGWTAYFGSSSNPILGAQTTIGYDTVSLGGAMVAIEDSNAPGGVPLPIQGNYSVLLEGSIPFAAVLASIGQTGTIPNTTKSLTFFGNLAGNISGENLQITFNGQNIPFSAIGNGANYTIYGANIAGYAGQTGQLLFTTPVQTSALLDNIQFSSASVPEPSTLGLATLGALLLGFRRWQNTL